MRWWWTDIKCMHLFFPNPKITRIMPNNINEKVSSNYLTILLLCTMYFLHQEYKLTINRAPAPEFYACFFFWRSHFHCFPSLPQKYTLVVGNYQIPIPISDLIDFFIRWTFFCGIFLTMKELTALLVFPIRSRKDAQVFYYSILEV